MSRADLPRTLALVAALLVAVISTSAFAREFRAADTQNEDYPTVQALRYMGRLLPPAGANALRGHSISCAGVTITRDFDRKPFEAAIHEKARRDPAAASLIERIRAVE